MEASARLGGERQGNIHPVHKVALANEEERELVHEKRFDRERFREPTRTR